MRRGCSRAVLAQARSIEPDRSAVITPAKSTKRRCPARAMPPVAGRSDGGRERRTDTRGRRSCARERAIRVRDGHPLNGTLLRTEIEVQRVAVGEEVEEPAGVRGRGELGPGAPDAPQTGPGTSQLRTWRSATGQGRARPGGGAAAPRPRRGARPAPPASFPPRPPGWRGEPGGSPVAGGRAGQVASRVVEPDPPTEGEGAANEGPVAADGAVRADLEVAPAEPSRLTCL